MFKFILFFLLIPSVALSAPAPTGITGDLVDGDSVVIAGTGFGTNTAGIKWLGGVIESGTHNATPSDTDGWVFNSGHTANPVVSTTAFHSGTKSLYHAGGAMNSALRLDTGGTIDPGEYIYATWWTRFTYSAHGQWKMIRLDYENDIVDGPQQIVLFNWTNSSDQFIARPGPSVSSVNNVTHWSPPIPTVKDRWYRMELEVKASSVGVANGYMTLRAYDPTAGQVASANKTIMSYSESTNYYRWLIW